MSARGKRQRSAGLNSPREQTVDEILDDLYLNWKKDYLYPLFRDLCLNPNKAKQQSSQTNWPLASMALTQYIFYAQSLELDWESLRKHWDFTPSIESHPQLDGDTFGKVQTTMLSLSAEAEIFANTFLNGFAQLPLEWLRVRGWGRALNLFLTAFPMLVKQRRNNTPYTWKDYLQFGKNYNLTLFQLFEKIVQHNGSATWSEDDRESFSYLKTIYDDLYSVDPIDQLRRLLGWGVISCVIYPFTEADVPVEIRNAPDSRIPDIIARFGGKKSLMITKAKNLPRLIQCNPKCLEVNGKYFLLLELKSYQSFKNVDGDPLLERSLASPAKDNRKEKLQFKAPIPSASHPGYIEFELIADPLPPLPILSSHLQFIPVDLLPGMPQNPGTSSQNSGGYALQNFGGPPHNHPISAFSQDSPHESFAQVLSHDQLLPHLIFPDQTQLLSDDSSQFGIWDTDSLSYPRNLEFE